MTKENEKGVLCCPDMVTELCAIPIARDGMGEEELRKICVDFMRLQLSFPWTPDRDYSYVIERNNVKVDLKRGVAYGGFPYVTKGSGNLYRIAEGYDEERGVLNMDRVAPTPRIFGNACSGAACIAWSRVISSVKRFGYTRHMTQKNGFLNVGPYRYPEDLEEFVKPEIDKEWGNDVKEYSAEDVCRENGDQVLFASYACAKPGDGIVNKGHVRMISSLPTVVLDENGKIDGEKSSIKALDQVRKFKEKKQPNGAPILIQGGVDVEYSFHKLFEDGYIPFTFAEFRGEAKVVEGKVSFSPCKSSPIKIDGAVIRSNVAISDVFIRVTENEKEVFSYVIRNDDFVIRELTLSDLPTDALLGSIRSKGRITIECQLYNGERLLVFSEVKNKKET